MSDSREINLIGKDLSNSLSFVLHSEIYKHLGYDLHYKNLEFNSSEDVLNYLRDKADNDHFISNVTYPYKKIVNDFCCSNQGVFDDTCKACGGCNFISLKPFLARNFDGKAAVKFFKMKDINIKDKDVVICGSGVTARSIAYELKGELPSSITIATRGDSRQINFEYAICKNYSDLYEEFANCDILIDATPLGVDDNPIIDTKLLKKSAFVLDIVYSDVDTSLVESAKKNNLVAFDGKGMLVLQAIYSIQEISKILGLHNEKVNDFEKLYNIGMKAISS